jgi:hypothetical protein
MVDAHDSKSCILGCVGSSPTSGTVKVYTSGMQSFRTSHAYDLSLALWLIGTSILSLTFLSGLLFPLDLLYNILSSFKYIEAGIIILLSVAFLLRLYSIDSRKRWWDVAFFLLCIIFSFSLVRDAFHGMIASLPTSLLANVHPPFGGPQAVPVGDMVPPPFTTEINYLSSLSLFWIQNVLYILSLFFTVKYLLSKREAVSVSPSMSNEASQSNIVEAEDAVMTENQLLSYNLSLAAAVVSSLLFADFLRGHGFFGISIERIAFPTFLFLPVLGTFFAAINIPRKTFLFILITILSYWGMMYTVSGNGWGLLLLPFFTIAQYCALLVVHYASKYVGKIVIVLSLGLSLGYLTIATFGRSSHDRYVEGVVSILVVLIVWVLFKHLFSRRASLRIMALSIGLVVILIPTYFIADRMFESFSQLSNIKQCEAIPQPWYVSGGAYQGVVSDCYQSRETEKINLLSSEGKCEDIPLNSFSEARDNCFFSRAINTRDMAACNSLQNKEKLARCTTELITNHVPVMGHPDGPREITLNTKNTWTINVYDRDKDTLRYFVSWGDEAPNVYNPTGGEGNPFILKAKGLMTEYATGTLSHVYTLKYPSFNPWVCVTDNRSEPVCSDELRIEVKK